MFFFDKYGDMKYGVLVSLIIILVSFGAVLYFTMNLTAFIRGASDDEICRTSILTAAQSKSFLNIGRSITPLKCPRKELVIKKKDVVENGVINQNKAHKIIVEEMYKCWDKVGAGKIDPFSNWKDQWVLGEDSLCLICSTVIFDEQLIDFMKGSNQYITSPLRYLKETKILGREETYFEYFNNAQTISLTMDEIQKIENTILLPNSLILVNMYRKEYKNFRFASLVAVGTVAVLVGGGIVVGLASGGAALPAWLVVSAKIITIGIVAKGIAFGGAAAAVYSASQTAFSDCPDCNAIGGIQLVPHNAELNMKNKFIIDEEEKEIPLCTKIVN